MEDNKKELLFKLTRKDFVVEAKVGTGKGGQNRNRRKTACRISHTPSGAEGNCQEQRSYRQNEHTAFLRLLATPRFKMWHSKEVMKATGALKRVDAYVEEAMEPKNLVVEVKKDGKWVRDKLTRVLDKERK